MPAEALDELTGQAAYFILDVLGVEPEALLDDTVALGRRQGVPAVAAVRADVAAAVLGGLHRILGAAVRDAGAHLLVAALGFLQVVVGHLPERDVGQAVQAALALVLPVDDEEVPLV